MLLKESEILFKIVYFLVAFLRSSRMWLKVAHLRPFSELAHAIIIAEIIPRIGNMYPVTTLRVEKEGGETHSSAKVMGR